MNNKDRDDAIEMLLQAAKIEAEILGGSADVLAASRLILNRALETKREREMTPYEKGFRDGHEWHPSDPAAYGYTDRAELEGYGEGYNDGCQLREDERVEQIERHYHDTACTTADHHC